MLYLQGRDQTSQEKGNSKKRYATMWHYPDGYCFRTLARRHSRSPGIYIWLCHMGNLWTGLYHTLEPLMDGREGSVCICLAFYLVLFPIGQCLNQRSSLCFWVTAPGPCSGHLASQISNTNM